MTETLPRYIVVEVSKNWKRGLEGTPISMMFADALNDNAARGYHLVEFKLDRLVMSPDEINETILAVFEHESHVVIDRSMNPKISEHYPPTP